MQTVSLPHYAKIRRTTVMLVAAAVLVAVLGARAGRRHQ